MKNDFVIKKTKSFKKYPDSILIEGLPGIANVSRICVDFLIEKLRAEKLCDIYSSLFPNSVMITGESGIKMFRAEFYHTRVNDKELILLIGDIQPSADHDSHKFSQLILDLCEELGVKTLITLGGASLGDEEGIKRVHGVATKKEFIDELSKIGVIMDGNDTIKLIIGAAGLLLGWGRIRGIYGFSLLVETLNNPQYVGIKESREVLKILIKYLGINVSLKDLDREIKNVEAEIKREVSLARELRKQRLMAVKPRYIG